MTTDQYQDLMYTTAPQKWNITHRLEDRFTTELLHAQLGISTESGEFADAIKRYIMYGKAIDRTNLLEELGDLTWYIGLAIQALGSTWGEVFEANIKKLAARYPDRFTEYHALNRDLSTERQILEDNIKES